jgi:fatty-acid peroxygenase
MPSIPHDQALDSTLALPLEGYRFLPKRRKRLGSDLIEVHLLFQPTICMSGAEAARLFYDNERFERKGAAPVRLQKTLLGKGGVQNLDGEEHRWRKQMFMELMTPANIQQLLELFVVEWHRAVPVWAAMKRVVLFDECERLLCRAACAWAGVPLAETEVGLRTALITSMIDGSGGVGLRHWRARRARKRAERWARSIIKEVRAGLLAPPPQSAAYRFALHRTSQGKPLSTQIAAVELLNIVRPIVAVARYLVFVALALHEHPEIASQLKAERGYAGLFVQEVRRYYPFFPFASARVKRDFVWQGYRFPKGRRVLLDLYGTNHDPRLWPEPEQFRPERFREPYDATFALIPQGGGEYSLHHRCAGEQITIELMKLTAHLVSGSISYHVPRQNLHVDLSRVPTHPKSRFVITNVRPVNNEGDV